MIELPKYLFLLCITLLSFSCSTTRDLPVKTSFLFNYDDEQYEIVSINAPDGDGINYLIRSVADSTIIKCHDIDQDGVLEIIQFGNLELDEANTIYYTGIKKAMEAGKFKNRMDERIYEIVENDTTYTIETFGSYIDKVYNRFTIKPLSSNVVSIFLDTEGDGTLDQIVTGETDFEQAQIKYQVVLEAGITNNQIHRRKGKFIVKFSISSSSP